MTTGDSARAGASPAGSGRGGSRAPGVLNDAPARLPAPLRRLHAFALLTACATFLLVIAGGLVTSTGSGLAVPDWPLSYGMLMPPMVGGIFYEHGHRMAAGTVAILTLTLMIWLIRREPRAWVRGLGVAAFTTIILQAVLGGLTVIFLLPTAISVTHACLAQAFFCLTVTVALVTSPGWRASQTAGQPVPRIGGDEPAGGASREWDPDSPSQEAPGSRAPGTMVWAESPAAIGAPHALRVLSLLFPAVVFVQLLLGALMRHTEAGLAIPDFPLAFGRILPPEWSPQIAVHFSHRVWALVVLAAGACLIVSVLRRASGHRRKSEGGGQLEGLGAADPERRDRAAAELLGPALVIGTLLPLQIALGAATVLSAKHVVPATAHVATGALLLATGLVLALRVNRSFLEAALARRSTRTIAPRSSPGFVKP